MEYLNENSDFDDPKEVDKMFDGMSKMEKELCEIGDRSGISHYKMGYLRSLLDCKDILKDMQVDIDIRLSLFDKVMEMYNKAERRNFCD